MPDDRAGGDDGLEGFRGAGLAAGGVLLGGLPLGASLTGGQPSQPSSRIVGIQVGAVSFLDEGTDKVLGSARGARRHRHVVPRHLHVRPRHWRPHPRGMPLPDHGKQEYDDNYHGGNFATPHPQYYRDTSITPEKAPDHPRYDVIADVLPRAHARG